MAAVLVVAGMLPAGLALGASPAAAGTAAGTDAMMAIPGVEDIVAEDDFEDQDLQGWNHGNGVTIESRSGGSGTYSLHTTAQSNATAYWSAGPAYGPEDQYNVTFRLNFSEISRTTTNYGYFQIGEDLALKFKTTSTMGDGSNFHVWLRDQSTGQTSGSYSGVAQGVGQIVKVSVQNDVARFKIWEPSNEPEPNWQQSVQLDDQGDPSHFGWVQTYNAEDEFGDMEYYMDEVKYYDHVPPGQLVNGTVRTQDGEPVANATVQVTTTDTSQFASAAAARRELQDVTDPTPPGWDPQLSLVGADGFYSEPSTKYPVLVEKEVIGANAWRGTSDLKEVSLRLPANQPILVTAWDPSRQGRFFNQHEYDRQWPGRHLVDQTVIFEKVSPTGEVVERVNVTTSQTYKKGAEGSLIDPDKLHYDTTILTTGYWRVRVAGVAANTSLYYQVGDPVASFRNRTPDALNGTTTDFTQQINDLRGQGKIASTVTVQTNDQGQFSAKVPTNAKVVHVQASKASDPDLSSGATVQAIENESLDGELNGSIYLPSQPKVIEPPADNVSLTVRELQYPAYGNQSALQEKFQQWVDDLFQQPFSELPPALQQRMDNVSREDLEAVYEQMETLVEENEELREQVQSRLNRGEDTEVTVDINTSDATTAELRERISAMNTELTQMHDTIETLETDTTASNGSVDSMATFDGALNESQVAVFAHYTNGTTRPVPDNYTSIDQSAAAAAAGGERGETTVRVEDFPLPEGVAGVSFQYEVVTPSGTGGARADVQNPAFTGEYPGLRAISCDTLNPGASENVTCTLREGEDRRLQGLSNVTIHGPDGTVVGSAVDGSAFSWTTTGSGLYHIRVKMTSTSGHLFVRTFRLRAGELGQKRPPSIMASSAPTGIVALVGDGFSNGDVRVKDGGREVVYVGRVDSASEAPGMVHVYGQSVSSAPESEVAVRVTKGNGTSVNKQVTVVYHGEQVPDELHTWRVVGDDADPITETGGSAGYLNTSDNGTTWVSPTGDHGSVTFKTTDPGLFGFDTKWWLENGLGVETDGILLAGPPVAIAAVVLVTRRRRDQARALRAFVGSHDTGPASAETPASPDSPSGPPGDDGPAATRRPKHD